MNKHVAKPIALIPSLDQHGSHAQLWSDDRRFGLVQVPEGALVAQGKLAVDPTYEHGRKVAERADGSPVVGIDSLHPIELTAEQIKDHRATNALQYAASKYLVCMRDHGNTIGMRADSVSADDGRLAVLFGLKRGLRKDDWTVIENTLTEVERDGLKNYGGRHWLLTWGFYILAFVIVVVGTWIIVTLKR